MAEGDATMARMLRNMELTQDWEGPRQPNGLPDLSQTPAFGQKGFVEGVKEFGPGLAADALTMATGPIGRGAAAVGSAIRSAPNLAKTLMGGLGLTGAASTAGEGSDLDPRVAEINRLDREMKAAETQLQRMATIKYQSTVAREQASLPIQKGIDAARARIEKLTGEIDAEQREKANSDRPFAERHPNWALGMTIGGPIASGLFAKAGLDKINNVGRAAAEAAGAARKTGDMGEMAKQLVKGQNWEKWQRPAKALVLGEAAAIPAELRAMGDFIDKKTLPADSKARQAIEEKMKLENMPSYLANMGLDVVSGAIGAGTGGLLARKSPKVEVQTMGSYLRGMPANQSPDQMAAGLATRAAEAERAEAALRAVRQNPQALQSQGTLPSQGPTSLSQELLSQGGAMKSLPGPATAQSGSELGSSQSPRTIYRVKGSDGKVRLHGEDGKFTSKPSKGNPDEVVE
jgi:hypothetical protein